MRNIKILFLGITIILCSSGCLKKGEHDPFISLQTRKARLTGSWEMQSGTKSSWYGNGNTIEVNITKDNFVKVHYDNSGKVLYTETGPASFRIELKKNGEANVTRMVDGGDQLEIMGVWNFVGGVGKQKNKEQIILHHTRLSYNYPDIVFNIKELRNKKLVLTRDASYSRGPFAPVYKEEFIFIR